MDHTTEERISEYKMGNKNYANYNTNRGKTKKATKIASKSNRTISNPYDWGNMHIITYILMSGIIEWEEKECDKTTIWRNNDHKFSNIDWR